MSAAAVNETVLLAIITALTGLGGAFLGAFVSMRIERQRQKQQHYGISAAIRMDLIRWIEAYRSMTEEWRQTAHARQGLNWLALAPIATAHFPRGLSALLFTLYSARETAEAAYVEMTTDGIKETARLFDARFALRQWALLAEAVIQEWDRYNERRLWRRVCARWRWKDPLDRRGGDAEKQNLRRVHEEVVQRLRLEYDYSVGENGELLPENHTQEAYARMQEEISAVQQRNNPGR